MKRNSLFVASILVVCGTLLLISMGPQVGLLHAADKVYRMIELTRQLDIKVHLTFTFGLPNDTPETIEETIRLACELPNDSVQFSIATPFPGTAMYELYDRHGWITTKDWNNYNGAASAVSRTGRFTAEELQKYLDLAHHRYVGSRARKALSRPSFREDFLGKLKQKVSFGADILVMQSAVYALTRELVILLRDFGYRPHIMLHERFLPHFQDILASSQLHVFSQGGDFRYPYLKSFCRQLKNQFSFAGAIIPTSNPKGSGYEEVKKIAVEAADQVITLVTVDGKLL